MNSFVSGDAAVLVSLPVCPQRGRQLSEKLGKLQLFYFVISRSFIWHLTSCVSVREFAAQGSVSHSKDE